MSYGLKVLKFIEHRLYSILLWQGKDGHLYQQRSQKGQAKARLHTTVNSEPTWLWGDIDWLGLARSVFSWRRRLPQILKTTCLCFVSLNCSCQATGPTLDLLNLVLPGHYRRYGLNWARKKKSGWLAESKSLLVSILTCYREKGTKYTLWDKIITWADSQTFSIFSYLYLLPKIWMHTIFTFKSIWVWT